MDLTPKGLKTRAKLLEAAISLFSQKGYNGTSTREIAQQASVAEGTLFRYFPSKKDLLQAILEPLLVDSLTDLQTSLEELSFQDALEQILQQRLGIIEANFALVKIVFFEVTVQPELRKAFIQKVITPLQLIMIDFLGKRIEQGHIKKIDPYIAVQMFLGLLFATFTSRYTFSSWAAVQEIKEQELLHELIQLFYQGVKLDAE